MKITSAMSFTLLFAAICGCGGDGPAPVAKAGGGFDAAAPPMPAPIAEPAQQPAAAPGNAAAAPGNQPAAAPPQDNVMTPPKADPSLQPAAGAPAADPAAGFGQPAAKTDPAVPKAGADVEKATVGVGKKGRYGGGILTEPVSALFRTQQYAVFNIQIPQAMNLFKAEHDRGPKSHEEFMKVIVKDNSLVLPELPAGDRYYFDAESQELMVEHTESK